jgi:hypothetical protein
MNKIVREHYPVEKLPLDLQEVAGKARTVTVTIEPEAALSENEAEEIVSSMMQARDSLNVLPESDPVGRIRRLRDEWDQ